MKREILYIIVFCGIALFNCCSKTETTAPVITVIGYQKDTISLNSTYNDLGAQASDNLDVTDVVTSDAGPVNPNTNLTGTYIIHYVAINTSGYTSSATRTVIVVNDAQKFAGGYLVADTITGQDSGIYNYSVNVFPSTTLDNLLYLSNFSDLGEEVTVTALIVKTPYVNYIAVSPSPQVPEHIRPIGSITGSGSVIQNSTITHMKDTINYGGNAKDFCRSTWTPTGPP